MSGIPQWVKTACGRWGSQKRRIWFGADWQGFKDGYANSFMGRLLEEREGAGQGWIGQHWAEVYYGDGLAVWRSLIGIAAPLYDALHVKYVWAPEMELTWSQKANLLEVSERSLYESLGRAQIWVQARLENPAQTQVLTTSRKKVAIGVENRPKTGPESSYLIKAPELSFAALHRSKLSVKRPA